MDDAVRDRITADVVEISDAVGGGDLYVRYDDEICFGDMCLECGAICGVEACACSPPRFPSFGSSPAGRQLPSSNGHVTAPHGQFRPHAIELELEGWVLQVQPKRP